MIPREVRQHLPQASLLHIEWVPPTLPSRPFYQRNRLANAARVRFGSLVITYRLPWLTSSARAIYPHLFVR